MNENTEGNFLRFRSFNSKSCYWFRSIYEDTSETNLYQRSFWVVLFVFTLESAMHLIIALSGTILGNINEY